MGILRQQLSNTPSTAACSGASLFLRRDAAWLISVCSFVEPHDQVTPYRPPYFIFLKKSPPKVLSAWIPSFVFSSVSSGIMGGGGPIGFFSSVTGGETGVMGLLGAGSVFRNRPNQPLDRLAFRESTLPPLRLWGRPSWALSFVLYAVFNRFRLNRRRILPGRFDKVGDAGPSSARRLVPAVKMLDGWELGDTVFDFPLAATFAPCFACTPFGVSGGVGAASSCIGDGSGGGMSVPSVREPNLRSRAGSSKRLALAALLVCDAIIRC